MEAPKDLGLGVLQSRLGSQGFGLRAQSLRLRVSSLGFRVCSQGWGLGLRTGALAFHRSSSSNARLRPRILLVYGLGLSVGDLVLGGVDFRLGV